MNSKLAEKLKANPYYKPSKEQQAEMDQVDEDSTIAFGKPPIHNTSIGIHPTLRRRKNETT